MEEAVQIDNNSAKKPRTTDDDDENGHDFISNLPESILGRILSLLPTKEVLRTCVLSKDWEYKWTCIYDVDINDRERFSLAKTRRTSPFVRFVNKVLSPRNLSLKRFRLCCHREYHHNHILSWMSAVGMRNVEDLEIVYKACLFLPGRLLDCSSLTKVKLNWPCYFVVPVQKSFSSLKILYLDKVNFVDERNPYANQLMFDFPVLETLELQDCRWLKLNFVEINAPALTMFKVIRSLDRVEVGKCQIKISKAKLVKFEFVGRFVDNFDFSASSVFSATIDIHVIRKKELQVQLLFKGFSGLTDLKISGKVVEALARSYQRLPLPKFNMLKRLEVSTKCNSGALLELLHVMPLLESIVLDMWYWEDYDYGEVESVPSCIVSHLNEIRFRRFSKRLPDYRMADFLLTNALRLKKMLGLRRESSKERQRLKMYGSFTFREESEEREIENFWAKVRQNNVANAKSCT
ncbi:F-box/FBD/LRR-repeat protein At3g14710-like [Henckelia pumila]|uniref:F-box/FBD/LRR-repeat protein At3g14710-like n=1 Tax=Henckelia pumila TaxID=405737 RepID=UPI003C6E386C